MKTRCFFTLTLLGLLFFSSFPVITLNALERDIESLKVNNRPKLGSRLSEHLKALESDFDIHSEEDPILRVVVELLECEEDKKDILVSLGFKIETSYQHLVQGYATPSLIEYLITQDYVGAIRYPQYPINTTSEGVATISADDLHSISYEGMGIKVAILDGGFEGYEDLLGTELPNSVVTKSYPSGELTSGGIHGTACAEIVYDVAPIAEMYLIKIKTGIDFLNAVDWLIAQDVDIISCSIGWKIYGAGNGDGEICEKVDEAASNGVLFVTSAGNEAMKHYEAVFNDPDSNSWHNFGATEYIPITISPGQTLSLDLRWSASWSSTQNEDYDLFLCDSSNTVVAASVINQAKDGYYPYEGLDFSVPTDDVYRIYISDYSTSTDFSIELFSNYPLDQYQTSTGSIITPADASGALTVGATDWSGDNLHTYSSQGPTNDGRIKPDVTAPSGVTNTVYGTFYGTSASAPHTAGAAALLLQQKSLTVSQLRSSLEETAVDLGTGGKDNLYGAGRIDVYEARLDRNDQPTATVKSPNTGQYSTNINIETDAIDSDGEVKSIRFQYNLDTFDPLDTGWNSIGVDNIGDDGWSIEWTTSAYTTSSAYVRARAYDGLEYSDWDTCDNPLTIDNTPPNQPTLTETVCGNSWTTENTPSYEWSDPGDTGTSVQYYQGQLNTESVTTVTSPHQPTLDDGEHTYKVRAVDQLDNIGDWSNTITVQVDTTGPTGSITINNDDSSTTSRDVVLTLTGDDDGSGLQDMSFRNENGDWSTPESFTSTKNWQLSEGIGEKTVYIRLRDNLGTESIYSDIIQLGEEPPVFTLQLDDGWNLVSFPVNLDNPSINDVMTGIPSYIVKSWSGTEYITPLEFDSGKAYWIKVESETSIDLYGSEVDTVNLELELGYNLVGGPITSVEASSVLSGYYVVASWSQGGYLSSSHFEPGVGYLVLVTSSTPVTLP